MENFITKKHSDNIPNHQYQTSNLTYYPNPFQAAINISFRLKESSFVNISIFNLNGELIKVLTHQKQEGGQYSLNWNGLDNGDNSCKPGVYLITLSENGMHKNHVKIIKR